MRAVFGDSVPTQKDGARLAPPFAVFAGSRGRIRTADLGLMSPLIILTVTTCSRRRETPQTLDG